MAPPRQENPLMGFADQAADALAVAADSMPLAELVAAQEELREAQAAIARAGTKYADTFGARAAQMEQTVTGLIEGCNALQEDLRQESTRVASGGPQ